jgi:N-acetylglutamate synthase
VSGARRLGGAHVVRLTPADVGRRVTVRSRIGGDHGGPRHTDAVGVLESWQAGVLRIRRRDGAVAEVAETALVAGRVIPDRAS